MDDYRLDAYDFDLPPEQIAQRPAPRRDAARMLVLDRRTGAVEDRVFADLPDLLTPGDVVVLNDTKVFPARLVGTREPGGGRAELFLVAPAGEGVWEALVRPGRKLREGARVRIGEGLRAEIVSVLPDGHRHVRFEAEGSVDDALEAAGRVPLPPYIRGGEPDEEDRARYQTVYARHRGAVAAPTAGLHFTPEVLACLEARGIARAHVTLHVGYGTFEPVKADDLRAHAVAAEPVEVSAEASEAINQARAAGRRVVAVGTTTTRALEAAADESGCVRPFAGPTGLTITPGYRFRAVDVLLTNFHLPRSSLLVLVGAFAGRERVLAAYRHAVAEGYRFYSYGDCMLIR
ncbi:MAG TPA: tRNA preQ1(34) S-adenosylmethionine ribosyltransferase-isomerase QueA [Rubricoccaceae bacterium]|nr:tRNA preQ1(34) S-adenosylmethionine ribosyltransferase-isomerase QueA [Rubricoccaceae bacterium]